MPADAHDTALLDLQDQVAAELAGKPAFAGVTILTTRQGASDSEIGKAAERFRGVFATVSTLEAKGIKPNLPGPCLEVPVVVTVIELPKLNRSSKGLNRPAEELAVAAARGLHYWRPAAAAQMLKFEELGPVEDDQALILALRFTTIVNLSTLARAGETP